MTGCNSRRSYRTSLEGGSSKLVLTSRQTYCLMEAIQMLLAILNTSIITAFGSFDYNPISLDDAKLLVFNAVEPTIGPDEGILSAVGHQSTAEILTELLEVEIPVNRIQFAQQVGQSAIVFKLKGRAPEGKILSREEIEEIGYEFGLLTRTA